MSVPNRKLIDEDFITKTEYINGIKVVCTYLILTDGSLQLYKENHYNEWNVCFYWKCWHFDSSVSVIKMYNPNSRTWREADEVLLYSYEKEEESTIEEVYKFDKLKGHCYQYENGVQTHCWEPSLWY